MVFEKGVRKAMDTPLNKGSMHCVWLGRKVG